MPRTAATVSDPAAREGSPWQVSGPVLRRIYRTLPMR